MVETRIDEIVNNRQELMPAEREVFRRVVEYVMSLQKIYDKGGKEICFQRLNKTLSSDIFDRCKKNPVEAYFKPAFDALECSQIYREFLEWGLANIIAAKSEEIEFAEEK